MGKLTYFFLMCREQSKRFSLGHTLLWAVTMVVYNPVGIVKLVTIDHVNYRREMVISKICYFNIFFNILF